METVECPICGRCFPKSVIGTHADRCLDEIDDVDIGAWSERKRPRVDQTRDSILPVRSTSCSSSELCDLTVSVVNTKQTSSASVARSTAGPSTLSLHSAQNTQTGNSCSGFGHSPSSEIFSGAEKMLKRNTKSANLMGFLTGAQKSLQPKTSAGRSSIKSPPFGQSVTHSDVDVLNMPQEKACNKFSADVLSPRPPVCAAGVVNESKSVVEAVPKMCAVKSSSQHSSLPACTPLAERMRPTVLSDFVGQGHIVGSQRPLRSLLESASVSSMILWGPPGCGKVSLWRDLFLHLGTNPNLSHIHKFGFCLSLSKFFVIIN